jgi:hypothetical protein
MIFWVLVALAAAPLVMAAMMFVMLRSGGIQRLHEKRKREEGER